MNDVQLQHDLGILLLYLIGFLTGFALLIHSYRRKK